MRKNEELGDKVHKMEENNKLEASDTENEKEEEMSTKKSMKSKKQGIWITKSYGNSSSATFYIPKIKIPRVKFPEPKYPSIFGETKKSKKRR